MLNTPTPTELRELAVRLAEDAGKELLSRQSGLSIDGIGVETKSSASDPVSAADRASEKLITDGLAEARPGDGLLGEEGASKSSSTGLTWVIDPLDGTVNYLYGRLDWCVSIDYLSHVLPAVRDIRRGGSAALDLCSVADGTADAYYEHVIQPWDIAAGALIAREAGASVISGPGTALPHGVLAAPPELAVALVELLTPRRLV